MQWTMPAVAGGAVALVAVCGGLAIAGDEDPFETVTSNACHDYDDAMQAAAQGDAGAYRYFIRRVAAEKEPAYEEAGEHQSEWRTWLSAVDAIDLRIKPHPTALPPRVGSPAMTSFCRSH